MWFEFGHPMGWALATCGLLRWADSGAADRVTEKGASAMVALFHNAETSASVLGECIMKNVSSTKAVEMANSVDHALSASGMEEGRRIDIVDRLRSYHSS